MKYPIYLILFATFVLSPFQLPAQGYWAGYSNVKYDGTHFYAVADQLYQVVKLDKTGNVIQSFGKRGKGPKEFSTDNLELLLTDSLLYVLDDRGMTITKIDKNTFKNIGRETIEKPASKIILYDDNFYGYISDFEESNPLKTGKQVNVFRRINRLREPESSLFKIEDPDPINPFYDAELMAASNNIVAIAREGKNILTIFHDDSLYRKKIPLIEEFSLGAKIERDKEFLERPMMKVVWKKNIMPEYMLITALSLDAGNAYLQVHSYKIGNTLIRYNLRHDRFDRIGNLSQGQLVTVSEDTVFTLNDNKIERTTLPHIRSCSKKAVTFYLSADAFGEKCTSCTDSFFEWNNYLQKNNIPINIVLEDNSWFGKNEITVQTISLLKQWNIWGNMSYKKDCNGCFDSSISAKFPGNDDSTYYSFPEPVSTLKNKIDCNNEKR